MDEKKGEYRLAVERASGGTGEAVGIVDSRSI